MNPPTMTATAAVEEEEEEEATPPTPSPSVNMHPPVTTTTTTSTTTSATVADPSPSAVPPLVQGGEAALDASSDPFLLEALQDEKNRFFLLRLEVDLIRFIRQSGYG